MNQVVEAIRYASGMHAGQVRKHNGRPYFEDHSLKLAGRVANDPLFHDNAIIIMLLHDVVEDCINPEDDERDEAYIEITNKFGDQVMCGVKELTNEYTKDRYPEWTRVERKSAELKRLSTISSRGKILKLYDRAINLEDLLAVDVKSLNYARESIDLVNRLTNHENAYQSKVVLGLAHKLFHRWSQ